MNTIEHPLPHGAPTQTPRRIVVHCMAAQVDYEGSRIDAVTLLDRLKLSAHVLIAPDGTRIRCRRDHQGAWHAAGHNADTLGVEILVPGVYDLDALKRATANPYVLDAQLNALVAQIAEWRRLHAIESIARHSDLDPQRRWFDPGAGFPWETLLVRTWSTRGMRAVA